MRRLGLFVTFVLLCITKAPFATAEEVPDPGQVIDGPMAELAHFILDGQWGPLNPSDFVADVDPPLCPQSPAGLLVVEGTLPFPPVAIAQDPLTRERYIHVYFPTPSSLILQSPQYYDAYMVVCALLEELLPDPDEIQGRIEECLANPAPTPEAVLECLLK